MESTPGGNGGRLAIGRLALIGGLCMAAGIVWPPLGGILYLAAAPILILGAAVMLIVTWHSPDLDRWGRALCTCGVAAYLMFIVALFACGDIEGGIAVGAQPFWQAVWIGAMVAAAPLLFVGGTLVLAGGGQARAVPALHPRGAASGRASTDGPPSPGNA